MRKYIHGMYNDGENKEYDTKYGIRVNTKIEKLIIGDSRVDIDGSDFLIKNRNFTEQDQQNYKNIVSKKNANRRYYRSDRQIDGSKLEKYKKIIAPIHGNGMFMEVDNNEVDYIH